MPILQPSSPVPQAREQEPEPVERLTRIHWRMVLAVIARHGARPTLPRLQGHLHQSLEAIAASALE